MYPHPHEAARPPAPPQGSPGNPHFNLNTLLLALRCWWHIAVPLGLLLAAGAGTAVYYLSEPTYTASAWVRIRERPLSLLINVAPEDPQKFVQNQTELMRSPLVLGQVTSDPAVAKTPELLDELDPVNYLRRNLKVINQGRSDFYEVKFSSRSPEHARLVANKAVDEFLRVQQGHELKSARMTIDKLVQQHVAQQADVKQLRTRLETLSKQYHGKDILATKPKEEDLERSSAIASLQTQLTTAEVEQAALKAQIDAEIELFQQASFEPSPAEVLAAVESMPVVRQIREKIADNKAKVVEHRQRSVDPARNPLLAQLERQVAEDEAALEKTLVELRESVKENFEKVTRARGQDAIGQMQAQLRRWEVMAKFYRGRLEEERSKRQEIAGDSLQLEFARADYERANQVLEQIAKRILDMQIEQQAPERVEILEYASLPTRADEDIPFKKMGLAGAVALLFPFGLAVGIEILYRRVSSREQLESTGGIAVVAEVTTLPARIRSRRRHDGMPNRERQLFEESIDGLRTYLSLVETMRGRKVLAVTSAISREGKTSLAAQLAVSIATSTNRPTLLIDGDMRSPDIHRIFDIDRKPGLSDVLEGACPVEEAIETGFSNTLHLLTAGDLETSPHRILGNGNFAEVLDKLRGMYDYIVLDTPPILAASEALLMASAADAAILCVRRDFSRVDQVSDAFARLRTAGVKTAGAVLNGIPPRNYAYRYGSYYYTRSRQATASPAADEQAAAESTAG